MSLEHPDDWFDADENAFFGAGNGDKFLWATPMLYHDERLHAKRVWLNGFTIGTWYRVERLIGGRLAPVRGEVKNDNGMKRIIPLDESPSVHILAEWTDENGHKVIERCGYFRIARRHQSYGVFDGN